MAYLYNLINIDWGYIKSIPFSSSLALTTNGKEWAGLSEMNILKRKSAVAVTLNTCTRK